MRINRYLAACGVGSRRGVESLITQGRVQINDKVAELGSTVESSDCVCVDGKEMHLLQTAVYAFHKPAGCLCSHGDPHGTHLIYSYLPAEEGLFSAGRLDFSSEGLLIVTNDGKLANRITHPKNTIEKEYLVVLDKAFSPQDRKRLAQGLCFSGISYAPARCFFHEEKNWSFLTQILANWPPALAREQMIHILLTEGKKREVRMLMQACGYRVLRLIRLRIGGLRLETLHPGAYRRLAQEEIVKLWEK